MQKRYVIYSAMVGAYDDILQPKVVDVRFDYILFSNDIKEKRIGVWEVRPIMYHNDDRTRICRYVKSHPEEMVSEYEVSVWMDASIQILTDYLYKRVVELDKSQTLIATLGHPARNCIYEEAFAVLRMRVEYEDMVVRWCHELRKENYPRNSGLNETGLLYRKHQATEIMELDKLWWSCVEKYSRRDQLSFNYALWKCGLSCDSILDNPNIRQSKHVQLIEHKDSKHNDCPMRENEAWLMRHLWKHPEDAKKIEELYYRLYAYPCPRFWVALAGQYYRLVDICKVYGVKCKVYEESFCNHSDV